jgi:hypothetical protein
MSNNTRNCVECRFVIEKKNKLICTKKNKEVQNNGCDDFDKLKFCNTCQYAKILKYDDIERVTVDYRCILQSNKLVYSDNNPHRVCNATYPECILGMYEEK